MLPWGGDSVNKSCDESPPQTCGGGFDHDGEDDVTKLLEELAQEYAVLYAEADCYEMKLLILKMWRIEEAYLKGHGERIPTFEKVKGVAA